MGKLRDAFAALRRGFSIPEPPQTDVFVSYARVDAAVVEPIVSVMRAVGHPTFLDRDSISPGAQWRVVIREAIEEASRLVLFWCVHSHLSVEVGKELQFALEEGIQIVPALLDDTPLVGPLAEYQAVDLRTLGLSSGLHQTAVSGQLEEPRGSVASSPIGGGGGSYRPEVPPEMVAATALLLALGK